VELAIPKLREGSFFPDWLLVHRRRAEQALVTEVATAYLLGVSTRRVERLAEQLGVKSLSRSQVSEMAAYLDAQVAAFRERPLAAGPYTFVWPEFRRYLILIGMNRGLTSSSARKIEYV
jgi:transposase-like protein